MNLFKCIVGAVSSLCRPLCGPVGKDLPDEKQSIYISMFHDLMENLTLDLCALHVQTAAALPHAGIVRLLLHCLTQALFDCCCCTASRKHTPTNIRPCNCAEFGGRVPRAHLHWVLNLSYAGPPASGSLHASPHGQHDGLGAEIYFHTQPQGA